MDKNTLKNLTRLSRIHCSEAEEGQLLNDLQSILDYVKLLDEVDTQNIPPCNHVLADFANVVREDVVREIMPRKTFLENAPDQIGGMIRVPPVIKKH